MAGRRLHFSDYQVNWYDTYNGSPVTRLINAGAVSTRGAEADLIWHPLLGLTLTDSTAYTDARIDRFSCPSGTTSACNVNGMTLPFSPKWKTDVSAKYVIPLGNGPDMTIGTDYSWRSSTQYSINQTPQTIQKSYGVLNAMAALDFSDDLRVSFLVKNILNAHYSTLLSTFSSGIIRYVPRDNDRYFGVDIRKEF